MNRHKRTNAQRPQCLLIESSICRKVESVKNEDLTLPVLLTAFFGQNSLLTRWFPNNRGTRQNMLTTGSDGVTPMAVDWISGACMLVRVEAFLKVGGYKNFFLCFNDLDIVLSMWELGYRVVYDERWTAIHKRGMIGAKKRRIFFEVRNLMWTIWGHLRIVPSLLITVKFVARALYDARGFAEYGMVVRAFGKGLVLGLRQRRRRTGQIPEYVLGLLYRNFLFSGRLSKGLMRVSPRLFVALKP